MNVTPFDKRIWLSSPTMHGEELQYLTEAYETNWMSTVGENINEVERILAQRVGREYGVGLSSGTGTASGDAAGRYQAGRESILL